MIKSKLFLAVCLIGLMIGLLPAWAQGADARYFEETGFTVSGQFLQFYDAHGGRAIFGYPLTREFQENGLWVQYFQRARMEKHPENPEPYRVQLGLLGDQLGYRQSPIPTEEIPLPTHPDKVYFPETGHTIAFAFLDFYRNNGGLDIFGYPITEWIIEPNGRVVQYFQRAKMEWYPENAPGQRIQLGMLGAIYVEQFVDPIHRQREPLGILPTTPTPQTISSDRLKEIQVTVTLKYAIIQLEGIQTAYVYVRDQDGHGVPNMLLNMQVVYGGGRQENFSLGPTNANGYVEYSFSIGSPPPGLVVIVNLSTQYQSLQARTSTAFLPWW